MPFHGVQRTRILKLCVCVCVCCETGTMSLVHGDTFKVSIAEHQFWDFLFVTPPL